jgi:hypothetical protein
MNVDDIFLVLHHHWFMDTATFPNGRQRLQVAFLVLMIAYTASRPGGRQLQDGYSQAIRDKYGAIGKSVGTELHV